MKKLIAVALLTLALTACGGTTKPSASAPASTSLVATTKAAPTYDLLDKKALNKALLGLDEMPAGYSQDPPGTSDTDKTFCDYKEPFKPKVKVAHDFTKGGGVGSEIASIGIRQYGSTSKAAAAFKALTTALAGCKGETFQGSRLAYSPMSAPKIGDGSVGVRIESDGVVLLQNFALVGPSLVNSGGGGLTNANADQAAHLLEAQVKTYIAAARN